MRIQRVEWENFLSFGPDNAIDLSDLGLVLVEGENQISTSASSNGAGKTSFMETIPWAFFGQTTKGVSADDVVNDQVGKDCHVSVFLEDGGRKYEIARFRKHTTGKNSLSFAVFEESGWTSLNGVDTDETQKKIEQFLGANFTIFCNSVYFSQTNVKPFCEYTDKQIKEVFVKILDLARYQAALEETRRDILKWEKSTVAEKAARDLLNREILEIDSDIAGYQESHATFDEKRKTEVAELDRKITDLQAKIKGILTELKTLPGLEEKIKSCKEEALKIPSLEKDLEAHRAATKPFNDNNAVLANKIRTLASDISGKKKVEANVEAKIGTKCTECGRMIEEHMLADYLCTVKANIAELETQEAKIRELAIKLAAKIKELSCKEKEFTDQITTLRQFERKATGLEAEVVILKRKAVEAKTHAESIKDLQKTKAERLAATSPYLVLISEAEGKKAEKQKQLDVIEASIKELEEKIQYAQYWERAFGYSGIQSFLLDARTPFLDKQANHYASIVSNGELQISFDTTKMTKKGPKDKFQIRVEHATGGKKYQAISGGERRRADICIAQAMFSLVRAYGRKSFAIGLYDEPFDASLDPEGISGVTELLTEISKEIGSVLIVTHVPSLKAHCERIIRVVKGKDGFSRIEGVPS